MINKLDEKAIEDFLRDSTMDQYQIAAGQFATYPGRGSAFGLWYCITKLGGESGEALEKLGKAFRDDGLIEFVDETNAEGFDLIRINKLTDEKREALIKELGDVLWYVARAAGELDMTLSQIAEVNLEKLTSRMERNVLQGSGDNR